MASLIANEFSEATNDLHLSALMAVGAVLFVVTIIVNTIARWLVWQTGRNKSGMTAPTIGRAAPRRSTSHRSYRDMLAASTARTLGRRRVVSHVMIGLTYVAAIVATLPLLLHSLAPR